MPVRAVVYAADMLEKGDPAPDFNLPDQHGDPVSLSGLRGKTVVLYFYPKPTRMGQLAIQGFSYGTKPGDHAPTSACRTNTATRYPCQVFAARTLSSTFRPRDRDTLRTGGRAAC